MQNWNIEAGCEPLSANLKYDQLLKMGNRMCVVGLIITQYFYFEIKNNFRYNKYFKQLPKKRVSNFSKRVIFQKYINTIIR